MHVLQTVTRPKKVTHIIAIKGQENVTSHHHCTSAAHVCEVLQGLGYNVTPAIVYRCCSKDSRRVHRNVRKSRLPETVSIRRASEIAADTEPEPQS
jgi:hypothetical protein